MAIPYILGKLAVVCENSVKWQVGENSIETRASRIARGPRGWPRPRGVGKRASVGVRFIKASPGLDQKRPSLFPSVISTPDRAGSSLPIGFPCASRVCLISEYQCKFLVHAVGTASGAPRVFISFGLTEVARPSSLISNHLCFRLHISRDGFKLWRRFSVREGCAHPDAQFQSWSSGPFSLILNPPHPCD